MRHIGRRPPPGCVRPEKRSMDERACSMWKEGFERCWQAHGASRRNTVRGWNEPRKNTVVVYCDPQRRTLTKTGLQAIKQAASETRFINRKSSFDFRHNLDLQTWPNLDESACCMFGSKVLLVKSYCPETQIRWRFVAMTTLITVVGYWQWLLIAVTVRNCSGNGYFLFPGRYAFPVSPTIEGGVVASHKRSPISVLDWLKVHVHTKDKVRRWGY